VLIPGAGVYFPGMYFPGVVVTKALRPITNETRALCFASLNRRSAEAEGWLHITDEQVEKVQRWMWERKRPLLAKVGHLTVNFDNLLTDSVRQIERVIEYLGLDPDAERIRLAANHVRHDRSLPTKERPVAS